MEKQNTKKIITMSFLGAALLTYVVVDTLFKTLAGAFGAVNRAYGIPAINHGLPILSAVIVFAVLQFSPRILAWAEDVVVEVSKVVWPSRKETVAMTIVVCTFVVISCVLLLGIDFMAKNVIQFIIR